jgi:hypothetical protein
MSEVALYQPPGAVTLADGHRDIDSWMLVAEQAVKLANEIANTPFVPVGLRGSPPATAAAILAGRELGIGPMTALAHIHVINGKPGLSAALMRALILAAGHEWRDVEVTDTRVVVEGRRRGEAEWTKATFTADQARAAKIVLGGYPQDKLYARATSRLARRKFADVIAGMPYSAEELEDGEPEHDAPAAEGNGHAPAAKPAARTAQRRSRAAADRPTTAAPAAPTAPTTGPATATTASSGDGPALPPLPGEEDPTPGPQQDTGSSPSASATGELPDYDTPGTVTTPQLTAIWTVFKNVFGFTADEREHARAVAAHIIGHPLESTRNMARNEAKAVLDTLGNWQELAGKREVTPRKLLDGMMELAEGGEPDA